MYSNPRHQRRGSNVRRTGNEQPVDTIYSVRMQDGAKWITVALQANWRGAFCRIAAGEEGQYTSVIIPAAVMADFEQCMENVIKTASKGMVEISGRRIFARMEADNFLIGEETATYNTLIVISGSSISEFQHLFREAMKAKSSSAVPSVKAQLLDRTLFSHEVSAGRKTIRVMLKENTIGRFVRISESDGLRFTSVLVPADNLEEFHAAVGQAIRLSNVGKAEEPAAS